MRRQPIDTAIEPTTLGIDVSHWQGKIDWARVATDPQRVRLAVVRTGDGRDLDKRAVENLRGASAAGLPVAVYHYVRGRWPARTQLKVMREVIEAAGVPLVFAALDFEGAPRRQGRDGHGAWLPPNPACDVTTEEVLDVLEAMRADLESCHRVVMYTGVAWHWYVAQRPELAARAARWADVPLWTAHYTSASAPRLPVDAAGKGAPWSRWTIWQYSSKGRIEGIRGDVDLNRVREL